MAEFRFNTLAPGAATSLQQRFWSKVDKKQNCWIWTACKNSKGYGSIKIGPSTFLAHRIALELTGTSVPPTACVLHDCDVPSCVNPEHLRVGTQTENVLDRHTKGRSACGEKMRSAKLNEADVREIRRLAKQGQKWRDLAKLYGVNTTSITKILMRRAWKHVVD